MKTVQIFSCISYSDWCFSCLNSVCFFHSFFISKADHLDQLSHLNHENEAICLCPYANSQSSYCLNSLNSTEHRELFSHLKKLPVSINIILFTLFILTYFATLIDILRLEYSAHYMQGKHFAATEFQTAYLFVASVALSIKSTFYSLSFNESSVYSLSFLFSFFPSPKP